MSYPFVRSWYNYGSRSVTFGLMYHMAEGGGTVGYLDNQGNPPSRGVSVHAVCEYSGRVVQMSGWGSATGSLNPKDRSSDGAYYGHSALVAVLGDWWPNPNEAVLSMEIEGHAADGPNDKQVQGAVAWGLDMRRMFPTLRGALGHTDQTDTKPCPGLSLAMRNIFEGVGGHGLWNSGSATQGDDVRFISSPGYAVTSAKVLPVKAGQTWQTFDGVDTGVFGAAGSWPCLGLVDAHSGVYAVALNTGDGDLYPDGKTRGAIVQVKSTAIPVDVVPEPPAPAADCDDVVAAQRERDRVAALAAVEGVYA